MPIRALNHFTVMSRDLVATRDFYCGALGLSEGPRPAMDFPGLWLYAGDAPLLHVIGVEEAANARGNVIDHVAFSASGLAEIVRTLEARGIKHRLRRMEDGGWQLFCRDPDGAMIELDFAAGEEAA